jgi:hypothetical protein
MSYLLESETLYFREIREQDINENYYAWMSDSDIKIKGEVQKVKVIQLSETEGRVRNGEPVA